MALSYNALTSGGSAGEDFTISIGSGGFTKSDLGRSFGSGNYICTSSLSDATLDIYFLNEDGTVAGYANATTATTSVNATKTFRYIVVYGATSNDTLTFQYKTVVTPAVNSTTDLVIGPRIISVVTTSLPNLNDTTVVNGQNFATDITATFTGTDNVARNAKSIVRSSSTSLIITRPDVFPPNYNPYTLTLLNPGTAAPTSSNAHKSINTISAGSSPVWVTGSTLHYDLNVAWNGGNLSATDADGGSSVTYSIVSGTLPTGLSLASNGTISGTPTNSQQTVTFRVTDSGGNYLDKPILFNQKPVWTTTSLAAASTASSYSQTLVTTDDTAVARTYSLVSGSLPAGLSLASNGVISGTPTAGNTNSLVFRATDGNGGTQDKTLTISTTVISTFNSSTSWTAPSGVSSIDCLVVAGGGAGANNGSGNQPRGAGGGGAGGFRNLTNISVTPGTTYPITVGAGGAYFATVFANASGSNSSIGSLVVAAGGGGGCANSGTPVAGGSGGGNAQSGWGGAGNTPATTPSQGNNGGNSSGNGGSGGGGAGAAGANTSSSSAGGAGAVSTITGSSITYAGGGAGSGGGTTASGGAGGGGASAFDSSATSGTANTGGGGGGASNWNNSGTFTGGNGGSGIVIIKYSG